ncbi:zinc finger, C3HC4 type (RING finger) protein (macronuclear) [Tetrahymena thermophila SB210]|uniref:Zinc finger, C3HC4 type (RING finger) protein n=1 Tax=Tetrahymena thermophila (strain SB210) TaxID=312017 RepID=Q23CX0_TETTS|nr:zinc finger, C3HC4 type (RING finger) protein [Tetrahymena thermophila SB210]EAR94571.2 zinc finger, C3HC4 type (RING finger) protein [Tetrahymena thermophila SB210]|eukprot:XP_001014916.2 zinc finger, C3HC4 type (RING finger) protein [Tetrahymena thermophila SB210]
MDLVPFMKDDDKENNSFTESSFDCPICLNILLRPVTLVCGHNFCEQCIKNEYFSNLKQQCPVCRKFILVSLRIIKVNLVLDLFIREYHKFNKEYQHRRNTYYEYLKQKKQNKFYKFLHKLGKKLIIIVTYIRKCIPFITLGFAIFLLYLIKYQLGKINIRKIEATYTQQLNKIFSLIKSTNNLTKELKPQPNTELKIDTPPVDGNSKSTGNAIDFQNLIFSKLIKYLFTNYIRLSLPIGVS